MRVTLLARFVLMYVTYNGSIMVFYIGIISTPYTGRLISVNIDCIHIIYNKSISGYTHRVTANNQTPQIYTYIYIIHILKQLDSVAKNHMLHTT